MPFEDSTLQNGTDASLGSDFIEGPGDPDIDLQRRAELKQEIKRLETFDDWPLLSPIAKEELARDGFYYLRNGDKVKCVFCNLILKNWEMGDVVREEHKKFNPLCPFLLNKNVGNIRIASSLNQQNAKHPHFIDIDARLTSFSGWPSQLVQRPDDLARAGFYYTGNNDSVTCFHCGGNLRNWESEDDPVYEHKHWFPNCEFVKTLPARSAFEMNPMIQSCINMGYDADVVRIVMIDRKKKGEPEFSDLNALIDAVEKLRFSQEVGLRGTQEQSTSRSPSSAGQVEGHIGASGETAVAGNIAGASSMQEEYRNLMDRLTCKICMERQIEVTFQPCGHFVACEECSRQLDICPVCRTRIRAMTRTYMS